MAFTINIDSFSEENITERTKLSAAVEAGAESVQVESSAGYVPGDIIYVGTLSAEGCEKAAVASVPNETTLNLSAPLGLPHAAYSDVTSVVGDMIHIYRAVNVDDSVPADDAFTVLATREIDPDQPSTYYQDSAGSSAYWYRTSYYNETTQQETPLSEAFRGDNFRHYVSLPQIRSEAGFAKAYNLKDSVIDEQRRQAESEVNSALAARYAVPFNPVPEIVRTLTLELATAHLLIVAYGNTRQYADRLKAARAALLAYATGDSPIIDDDGTSQAPEGVSGYFGEEDRLFRIGDMY